MTRNAVSLLDELRWLSDKIGLSTGTNSRLKSRTLQQLLDQVGESINLSAKLQITASVFAALGLKKVQHSPKLLPIDLPAVAVMPEGQFRFVYGQSPDGKWMFESLRDRGSTADWPEGTRFLPIRLPDPQEQNKSAQHFFDQCFGAERAWMYQSAIASIIASVLALGTSLYSMQVYDRVIGQGGIATLVVLTVGVAIGVLTEFAVKLARSKIMERAVSDIDLACAQGVFSRLLKVRMDQFPTSVGTLSAQVRGFEAVRSYRASLRIFMLTDAPFALFFLVVIYLLGGPVVAIIPSIALVLSILAGWSFKEAVERHSSRMDLAGNKRQGLMVEVIQAAELLKASGAGWIAQSRWNELSKKTTEESSRIKSLNDTSNFLAALIQQLSYTGLVAAGAYVATSSQTLTVGAIIACSIIAGRVLAPISQIPGLLVQSAHAGVALGNLEKLYELENDHHDIDKPLQPEVVRGTFEFSGVEFGFPGQNEPLSFQALKIEAGERVAILGAIGTGKSTLLKLLAGLLKPQRGQILLDGMDIQQIDVERRAEIIGYLPQNTRLMSGTLRENLNLGCAALQGRTNS
jgi:ATP-binding cassette, subfamily C, bacterial LapB